MIVVDRFEGEFAILLDAEKGAIKIKKDTLSGAKEGDVVILIDGKYVVDKEETEKRKKNLDKKFFDLFE